MSSLINQIPLIITVVSAAAAMAGWAFARVRKGYGLERDINHLKNDYQALSLSIGNITNELERRLDVTERELAVLRGVNQALIARDLRQDQG